MKLKCNLPQIENSSAEIKEFYLSPVVEIIEVKVEKGFALSPLGDGGSGTGDWGGGAW